MAIWNNDHGDTQDRVVRNVVDVALSNVTDSIIDTHSAVKVLAITIAAEIGLLTMFFVSKDKAADFIAENEPDIWIYGAIAVFLIGFLTAFALYRMISNRLASPKFRYLHLAGFDSRGYRKRSTVLWDTYPRISLKSPLQVCYP